MQRTDAVTIYLAPRTFSCDARRVLIAIDGPDNASRFAFPFLNSASQSDGALIHPASTCVVVPFELFSA